MKPVSIGQQNALEAITLPDWPAPAASVAGTLISQYHGFFSERFLTFKNPDRASFLILNFRFSSQHSARETRDFSSHLVCLIATQFQVTSSDNVLKALARFTILGMSVSIVEKEIGSPSGAAAGKRIFAEGEIARTTIITPSGADLSTVEKHRRGSQCGSSNGNETAGKEEKDAARLRLPQLR